MSIENIVKEIVTSGGHNPDDKSIVDNVTPQGRDTVAGMKPITIKIPDDRLRSNRIELRHKLVKAFRSAGLDPKDANVRESIIPIEVKEARLIAVSVSAAIRCEYCVSAQVHLAKKSGATDDEIRAAIQIAAEIQRFSTLLYGNEFGIDKLNKIIGKE